MSSGKKPSQRDEIVEKFWRVIMLCPRIIPCLLVHNKGLVKTVKFKDPKYVGDPINAVKIFNEKEADELMVLDIDASVENREPDYQMIEHLALECRMPLCYGGGIKSAEQAQRIFKLGVEKIAISSAAIKNPELVARIAKEVGSQSVVVIIDVKKKIFGGYDIYTLNGKSKHKVILDEFILQLQKLGVGEIVLNSIDQDGVMKGYELDLIDKIKPKIVVPLTVLGGAGSADDIHNLIQRYGIIGAAAGSLFVFKGKYKAVLINYPKHVEKIRPVR
jgi:imidazole glycerol-phosphate synthase subunit HisF